MLDTDNNRYAKFNSAGPGSTLIPVGFSICFCYRMNNCIHMDNSLHEEDEVIIINPDERKFSNVLKFRTAPISECIVFDGRG